MLGEDISSLSVSDLLQLEKQLDEGATKVRARKASVRLFLNGVLFFIFKTYPCLHKLSCFGLDGVPSFSR